MSAKKWKAGLIAFTCVMVIAASFADWRNWRGPEYDGSSQAANLPNEFSLDSKKNIAWMTELDGEGSSTPIVVGDRLYLTAETMGDHGLWAVCLDRKSGDILWRKRVGTGRKTARNNMASPSPVSDGERVCFLYGNGILAAFDLEGNSLWKRELESKYNRFTQKFGYSSSPLLYNGQLYVSIMRWLPPKSNEPDKAEKYKSWLLALDPQTGKTIWDAVRPTPALKESRDSYNTPVVGRRGIILVGGDLVTSHDPRTGQELWRYDYRAPKPRETMWRIISSPIVVDDLLICAYPRGGRMFALRLPAKGQQPKMVWDKDGHMPDVCTPACEDGLLYVLDGRRKNLTCLEPESGEQVWRESMPSRTGFYASPTVADGKIYCLDRGGDVFVLAAGRQPALLGHSSLGEKDCNATIVPVDNVLYIRSPSRLFCVSSTLPRAEGAAGR